VAAKVAAELSESAGKVRCVGGLFHNDARYPALTDRKLFDYRDQDGKGA
jgi:hypothetical protein